MKNLTASILVLFISVLFQSCYSADSVNLSNNSPTKDISDQTVFFGHYTFGHEVNSFQPCLSDKQFWVEGNSNTLEQLEKSYDALKVKPYQDVYVELTAKLLAQSDDGFAASYDGNIYVNQIIKIRKKSEVDCKLKN
ncbi:hypothetical protein ACM9HF_07035 [Colwellia sp. RE-S-Sl-9]